MNIEQAFYGDDNERYGLIIYPEFLFTFKPSPPPVLPIVPRYSCAECIYIDLDPHDPMRLEPAKRNLLLALRALGRPQ